MPVISSRRLTLVLGTAALALCLSACGVFCAPRPRVSSLSPAGTLAGKPQFFLTVNGSNFRFDTLVIFNGGLLPTTFLNTRQIVALVFAADVAVSGTAQVGAFTPPGQTETFVFVVPGAAVVDTRCGGGLSNTVPFNIKE